MSLCEDSFLRRIDVRGQEMGVGALDDQDAVVRLGIDEDRRDTAGHSRHGLDVPGVDAVTLEVLLRVRAEQVVAHFCDHAHIGAEERRGDGLVGALAAEPHLEPRRLDGLPLPRHPLDVGDEVHHVAPDDGDLRLAHLLLLGALCQSARMAASICRVSATSSEPARTLKRTRPIPGMRAHVAFLLFRRVPLGIAGGGQGHAHDLLVVVNEDPAHRVVQLPDVPADIVGGAVGVLLQHVGHAVGVGAEVADVEDDLGVVLVLRLE